MITGLLLGLLLYSLAFKYIIQIWEWSIKAASPEARHKEIGKSVVFFTSLGFVMIVIVPSWMQFVQEFHMYPIFCLASSTLYTAVTMEIT
ncbi:hypothetical protein K1719_036619 [Acacia pycnantha]|nr:hypothetical protein K1719_036619 [Acacia pycnantha]